MKRTLKMLVQQVEHEGATVIAVLQIHAVEWLVLYRQPSATYTPYVVHRMWLSHMDGLLCREAGSYCKTRDEGLAAFVRRSGLTHTQEEVQA